MTRKNGHEDDCTFVKGQGWTCVEGCQKAAGTSPPSSEPAREASSSSDASDDYRNHPKFAKFKKGT